MNTNRLLAGFALTFWLASKADGAGLINPNFEIPAINVSTVNYLTPPVGFGWQIQSGGDIDLIHSTFWQPSSGSQSIDLNGFAPGSIFQDITFPSAGSWVIKFDLAANPDQSGAGLKTVQVGVGLPNTALSTVGTFSFNSVGRSPSNMGWQTVTSQAFLVDATTTFRVQFTSLTPNAIGPALDNIRLELVPEPGVASLILLAGGCCFAIRRKSQSKYCAR